MHNLNYGRFLEHVLLGMLPRLRRRARPVLLRRLSVKGRLQIHTGDVPRGCSLRTKCSGALVCCCVSVLFQCYSH